MNLQPHTFYSSALNSRKTCYVYLPTSYSHSTRNYPVIYLLHGKGGSETDWIYKGRAVQTMEKLTARDKVRDAIVVMPNDGEYGEGTFYLDWYDGSGHFEQYIVHDLVSEIDRSFRTISSRSGRVIGGFSMGGYGALMLSLKHPELFGAAASLAGVLRRVEEFPPAAYARMLGPASGPYAKNYDLRELVLRSEAYSNRPELYFCCGTEDPLIGENRDFHRFLNHAEYRHFYKEQSGEHSWDYCKDRLPDVLEFFEQYFFASLHEPVKS